MKKIVLLVVALGAITASLSAQSAGLTGTYVEARTAEVFAGGCVVNGEAGTAGREALLAWRVERGRFNGIPLEGLSVVAAVSADTNLGVHEIGGEVATTRTALFVDSFATVPQRRALVAMAKTLAGGTIGTVVQEVPASIEFVTGAQDIRVTASTLRLTVRKELNHEATCGNKQWFSPLSTVHHADMGTTVENAFTGTALGTKWSDPNKRSAFFGMFAY